MIMSSLKHILIALALIAFLALTGCRKTPTTNEQAASPSEGQERLHPDSGITPPVQTKFFEGSIGNSLDLQMKLVREGDKLTGSYFYQRVGTKIDLRGSVDQNGNVNLQEFDSTGKQTGEFKGVWKQNAEGAIEISGNWSKPNSPKKTTFALHQQPIEFSNGAEIVSKQIREKNKKLKYEVAAAYPQINGSVDPNYEKFNQTVRGLIAKKVSDFRKDMTPDPGDEQTTDENPGLDESMGSDINIFYQVALAKDDLIDIEFTVSSYSAGAAHPNSYTEVVNYDLKNGKLIKLADLFQPGAKYLQALSNYCIQDLQRQAKVQGEGALLDEDWIKKGAGAEPDNYGNWAITKKGVEITFDPYQVAAYAAGPQTCMVPYAALKDIIKPDGPARQFVK